jgi:5-methyltetrahydrofolate--homocysteine methyltransferase
MRRQPLAIEELFEERGQNVPVMISGTITDASGRTLSGQTVEAFWISIQSYNLLVGLNCALGAEEMRPYPRDSFRIADCNISAYPNAGLPNEFGNTIRVPEMKEYPRICLQWICKYHRGCCGTTPDHIGAMAEAVKGVPPASGNQGVPGYTI